MQDLRLFKKEYKWLL